MWWVGFVVVVASYGLALFARWRMRRDEPRRLGYVRINPKRDR